MIVYRSKIYYIWTAIFDERLHDCMSNIFLTNNIAASVIKAIQLDFLLHQICKKSRAKEGGNCVASRGSISPCTSTATSGKFVPNSNREGIS